MIAPSPNAAARGFRSHFGSCTVHCNGTQLRAHRRDQLTIIEVTGDIDATNIYRFYDYISRFLGEAPGLVLDLSEVHFLCAQGISVLFALDNECRTAGTHWAVVGSRFIRRLLHIGDPTDALPTAASERQALNMIAEQRPARLSAASWPESMTPNADSSRQLSSPSRYSCSTGAPAPPSTRVVAQRSLDGSVRKARNGLDPRDGENRRGI